MKTVMAIVLLTVAPPALRAEITAGNPDLGAGRGSAFVQFERLVAKDAGPGAASEISAPAPTAVVFSESGITGHKLSASQMTGLLKLAGYVYDNKPKGVQKSSSHDIQHFEISGDKIADGGFALTKLIFNRYTPKHNWRIIVYPDGTVDNTVEFKQKDHTGSFVAGSSGTRPLDKEWLEILAKEVSFWIEHGAESGGYNPVPTNFSGVSNNHGTVSNPGGGDSGKGEGAHWDNEGSGQGAQWDNEGHGQGARWYNEGSGQGAHWGGGN